jgi:hypothetical protein
MAYMHTYWGRKRGGCIRKGLLDRFGLNNNDDKSRLVIFILIVAEQQHKNASPAIKGVVLVYKP